MTEKLPGIKHIIATSSGKGGVGKSTVSVNLALALQQKGFKVGLADVDIYGPSIPGMLGLEGMQPQVLGQQLLPLQAHEIKVMSMGFLVGQDAPAILRGPMITKFIQQFVSGVQWGELDFLILDMPPGTGDAQLSLAQTVPLTGALVVTTPQAVSVKVAIRGLRMFEKVRIPILGVIENMTGWANPGATGEANPFQGGRMLSEGAHVPFLGSIPMDQLVAVSGDEGKPVMIEHPHSPAAQAYRQMATRLLDRISDLEAGASALGTFRWTLSTDEGAPHRPDPSLNRSSQRSLVPVGLGSTRDGIEIQWQDGTVLEYDFRGLRLACPCAQCIDEMTGAKILQPNMVPVDVRASIIESVGAYAFRFNFSDGHATGLYTFELLRSIGEARQAALEARKATSAN
jgi:ATP-binding protein involved in chromosome partitioning